MFTKLYRSSELYLAMAIVAVLLFAMVQDLPAWQRAYSADTSRSVVDMTNTGAKSLRGNWLYSGGELPDVVIDFAHDVVQIRLDRVVLNEFPFENSCTDSTGIVPWCSDSNRNSELQISRVHLHRATPLLDSTKLAVISTAVNNRAEYLQRYLPGELVLRLSDGRRLRVMTDINGESLSWKENTLWNISEFFGQLTGTSPVEIRMSARDAMALYGISVRRPKVVILCGPSDQATSDATRKR